jgi:hypothetical protein
MTDGCKKLSVLTAFDIAQLYDSSRTGAKSVRRPLTPHMSGFWYYFTQKGKAMFAKIKAAPTRRLTRQWPFCC